MSRHTLRPTPTTLVNGTSLWRRITHSLSGESDPRIRKQAVVARSKCARQILATTLAATFVTTSVWAQDGQKATDITSMSVEDLMNNMLTVKLIVLLEATE